MYVLFVFLTRREELFCSQTVNTQRKNFKKKSGSSLDSAIGEIGKSLKFTHLGHELLKNHTGGNL